MITQNESNNTKDKTTMSIHIFQPESSDKYANTYHKNITPTSLSSQNGLNSIIVDTKLIQLIIIHKFSNTTKCL